jgi:alpha-amylase
VAGKRCAFGSHAELSPVKDKFVTRPLMRLVVRFSAIALALSACTAANAQVAAPGRVPPAWTRNATIYEVNVRQFTPEGTLAALQRHLPRLRALGVDILWIMPVQPIGRLNRKGSLGSPYSVADYTAINAEYGTATDFKTLVDSAHKLGMRVILDWVPNHTAFDHPWITQHPSWYVHRADGTISNARDGDGRETDWTDVAELNYDNADMRRAMIADMRWWLTTMNIDGFRCDVAMGVPTDFWVEARQALTAVRPDLFMLAEAESPALDGTFDMTYGWELHHLLNEIAQGKQPTDSLDAYFARQNRNYPARDLHMDFTSDHDENSWNGTEFERMGANHQAAFVLAATAQSSMPLLYTGQEVSNKKRLRFFEKDTVDWSGPSLASFYSAIFALKHAEEALSSGTPGGEQTTLVTDGGPRVYAFSRTRGTNTVVVALNFGDAPVTVRYDGFMHPGSYTDWFLHHGETLSKAGHLEIPAHGYRVLTAGGAAVTPAALRSPPAWTRGATCYEVFVRSFADGDGDGIGDLKGLTAKLDYINDGKRDSRHSLGARCIWLMPVAESPSYHGYDATDYYKVERDYGTNDDFKTFVSEAHRRGIKVLVDMVLNHSSNENPWFQAALRDTTSPYRAWYRFSSVKPTEKGPWGQEAWHKSPVRDEYYYGIFWSGMPDLNYETPAVVAEAKKIARFWITEMHVDGFRLDAVPYLMEDHGLLQHSPGTHALLHDYAAYVRSLKPDAFTVGEVYAPIDSVLGYYPDQLDSYFAFEVADSLLSAVRRGSAKNLLGPALRLQREVPAGRWSPFLRNHDQPRTRTELDGSMPKAKVAAFLLLALPGMPFVYYGEEIGMTGTKPDEQLRTPMQWSGAAHGGFTRGTPWEQLAHDSLAVTVEEQERDSASLLQLNRRMIHLRDTNMALARGRIVPLTTNNDAIAAFARRDGDHVVLVIANLSGAMVENASVTSAGDAFPVGRWKVRSLLGGDTPLPLRVGRDGRVDGYAPLPPLAPFEFYLLELTAPGR